MTRASKPNVPTKNTGDYHYASEVNAVDSSIDAVIDDYVSQTDTNNQNVASNLAIVAGKTVKTDTIGETTGAAGVTVDQCLIKDGKVADSNLLEGSTKAQVQDHTPKVHKDSHKSGGSDPFLSTDVLEAVVKRLQENTPTTLTMGAIADGQYLKRSASSIIGAAGTAQAYKLLPTYTIYKVDSTYYAMDDDGNIDFSGTDASAVIQQVNSVADDQLIFLKKETYSLSGLSLTKRAHFKGETGTVFTLTSTSPASITVSAESIFENIEFDSTLNGNRHVDIKAKTTFRKCSFDFPLSTGELRGVMETTLAIDRIVFEDCTIIQGGKVGATNWGLLRLAANLSELIIRNFLVKSVIADTTPGRFAIFVQASGTTLEYFEAKNIEVLYADTIYAGGVFFAYYGTLKTAVYDGFIIRHGNWHELDNSYFTMMQSFNIAEKVTVSNVELYERNHPVFAAKVLTINNFKIISEALANGQFWHGGIDLGAMAGDTGGVALINNVYFEYNGICMNTGWRFLSLTNCHFKDSAIAVIDEGTPTGLAKYVEVSNCQWEYVGLGSGGKSQAFSLGYVQGINLPLLSVTNCQFRNLRTIVSMSGPPQYATHIVLRGVTILPIVDATHPALFGGESSRTSDDHRIWISDSEIATYQPPLNSWNPVRPNDRFTNVKWINVANDAVTYSENNKLSDTFAIDSTGIKTVTIAHGLPATPNIQNCQINVVMNTTVDDWAYNLLKVESVDATNVTVKINVSTASTTGGATAKIALRVRLT